MKNHALIKFTNKHDVRSILRQIEDYQKSSIYVLGSTYYLYILSSSDLSKFQLTEMTSLELELLSWAKSELENPIQFINYETQSSLVKNGRQLIAKDGIIIRSFTSLVEFFGVLNFNSDSFSDGGTYDSIESAVKQANDLIHAGVEIIDIGVESTRPGAISLDAEFEISQLQQLLPEIQLLRSQNSFRISIDTYHKETVKWLINQHVDFINDVSGLIPEDLVLEVIKSDKCYVAMHSLVIPSKKNHIIDLTVNPIEHILNWIGKKLEHFAKYNIDFNKLIIDPGIGFGNNSAQAWYILSNIHLLKNCGIEILVGHSRKSFFNHVTSLKAPQRDLATAVVAGVLADQVDYFRLHDSRLLNEIYPLISQLQVKYNA